MFGAYTLYQALEERLGILRALQPGPCPPGAYPAAEGQTGKPVSATELWVLC